MLFHFVTIQTIASLASPSNLQGAWYNSDQPNTLSFRYLSPQASNQAMPPHKRTNKARRDDVFIVDGPTDAGPQTKRAKTAKDNKTTTKPKESPPKQPDTKKHIDSEGNPYWEVRFPVYQKIWTITESVGDIARRTTPPGHPIKVQRLRVG